MSVEIKYKLEARDGLKRGVDALANAVKVTLGPKGRNVVIEDHFGTITTTKDGVSVAKQINLPNKLENIGANMVKEVATKTNDLAGDGTTTATVLAQAIVTEGLMNVAAGANPIFLKRGIDKAVKLIVNELNHTAKTVGESLEMINQVASISANNDSEIGDLITEGFKRIGNTGIITIEESKNSNTYINVIEGMNFDRGFTSPHFVTDPEKNIVEFDNPYILLTDKKLNLFNSLIPVLEKSISENRPLLIIADDVDNEVLANIVVNKLRGGIKVAVVKAPSYGERRKAVLEDIAISVGGTVISDDKGIELDSVTSDLLGTCDKVRISKDETLIFNGYGDPEAIKERIEFLKSSFASSTSDYDKGKFQERLGKLTTGVGVIYVGATSEVEMKEKKDRVEDALNATKAAIEEGIVSGGGVALLRTKKILDKFYSEEFKNKIPQDELTGIKIIMKAIEAPLRAIVENAGEEASVVIAKVLAGKNDFGYNAKTGEYVKMLEAGIIDPKKVTRVALENAASVASIILTTEAVLVPIPQELGNNLE